MWTDRRRRRPRLIKLELIIIYLLVCIISYMHNPTLLACIIILNEDNAHLVSALALFAPRGAAAWSRDEASAAWSRDEASAAWSRHEASAAWSRHEASAAWSRGEVR